MRPPPLHHLPGHYRHRLWAVNSLTVTALTLIPLSAMAAAGRSAGQAIDPQLRGPSAPTEIQADGRGERSVVAERTEGAASRACRCSPRTVTAAVTVGGNTVTETAIPAARTLPGSTQTPRSLPPSSEGFVTAFITATRTLILTSTNTTTQAAATVTATQTATTTATTTLTAPTTEVPMTTAIETTEAIP